MDFRDKVNGIVLEYGFKLLAMGLVLSMGWWLTKYAVKLIERALLRSKVDISVHGFIKSVSSFLFKFVVVITAARIIDVPVTTFIAILSAAGLAIGLALKDSMSNFAAGMLLLIFRPFNVGDYIATSSVEGTVLNVQILYTSMNTVDNKRVMVPNGAIVGSHIVNYSVNDFRRIDRVYSVAYGSDVQKVKEVLMSIVLKEERILEDRGIILGVIKHNESSIDFDLKVWVQRTDYLSVLYALNEEVLKRFTENGLKIPYPTRNVMMMQSNENKDEEIPDPEEKAE